MSTDCRIELPRNVRINDVMRVIGAVVGLPVRTERTRHGEFIHVDGIAAGAVGGVPEMAQITFGGRFVFYHFEGEASDSVIMTPSSTAFWIAVGKRLVEFFGGRLDYNDCDDKPVDVSTPFKPDAENRPTDGESWANLQARILMIEPLTKAEMDAAREHASYKEDSYTYEFDAAGLLTTFNKPGK